MTPFDIAKSLSEKTELEYDISDYNAFMINRIMSNTMDTLFFAEVMNRYHHLNSNVQRDFYLHGLTKKKRYGKWNKSIAINTDVQLIMNHFNCNFSVATSYYNIMNDDAINKLRKIMSQGGSK